MMQSFEINSNQIDKIKKITAEEKNFRIKNLELFRTAGFPNKRLEDWKFSDFENIIDRNFEKLDTKNVSSDIKKINLLKDFEHNYILLVNGNLHSSNFDYEEKSKIKINPYDNSIVYEISKNPLICLNHALAEGGYSLEIAKNYKLKKVLVIYNYFTKEIKNKILNYKNYLDIIGIRLKYSQDYNESSLVFHDHIQVLIKKLSKQQKIKNEVKKTFTSIGLSGLKESFNLPKLPKIIECYDISHIQGSNVVGSLVVFENGKPKKSLYRKFNIKSFQGNDDYAALKEVIKRRIKHINQDKFNPLNYTPDLILIDGGKGQLNSVQEELLYSGFNKLNIASIAKKNELIFLPGIYEPIKLEGNSPQLFLIQQIRDEAHRFAVNFHRTKRSDKSLKSELDNIEGLGPKRKKAL